MEGQGQPAVLGVPEQVLHQGVVEGQVGGHLADTLAAALHVVVHLVAQVRVRRVGVLARVNVHERDDEVWVPLGGQEDLRHRLNRPDALGIDARQGDDRPHSLGLELLHQLLGSCEVAAELAVLSRALE